MKEQLSVDKQVVIAIFVKYQQAKWLLANNDSNHHHHHLL